MGSVRAGCRRLFGFEEVENEIFGRPVELEVFGVDVCRRRWAAVDHGKGRVSGIILVMDRVVFLGLF